ncbi:hypothetical protein ACH42_11945 [Endozoicomonas sp. (ex Bugula neritina AB1)]|nr:hypothetical protein ACH42_11945 [Endozoicomonas sp. (ex Bugula neritina AB1)]
MSFDKLSSSDLNLLPVLQVLLEECNVTRAAGRLNLTQPAISRSLARLRVLFNDPLFTRSPKGLTPTPRAVALSDVLHSSLQDISQLIETEIFTPETAGRSFRLATTDYGTQVLLPSVIRRINREAPNVDLEIVPWHEQLLNELDDIDVAASTVTDTPTALHGRGIGEDRFVCVVGRDHPLANTGFTLENYANCSHALITMGGKRRSAIDYMLEKYELERRIALRTPHFVAALALIADTNLVLTIPYGLAQACAAHYHLKILPFPAEQNEFTYSIIWHERYHKDSGHIWFRGLLYEELTQTIQKLQAERQSV